MEVDREEIQQMADEIHESQEILTALGDHMRLHLILVMLHDGDSNGMRVGSIAEKARISRPAVSHHLQILKRARIMKVRREGTKNYPSMRPCSSVRNGTLASASALMFASLDVVPVFSPVCPVRSRLSRSMRISKTLS